MKHIESFNSGVSNYGSIENQSLIRKELEALQE